MLYEQVVNGPDGTNIILQVSTIKVLAAEEDARLRHQMEKSANAMLRRYNNEVASWGPKKMALAKLSEAEAELLGLGRDWRDAQTKQKRKPEPELTAV